MVFIPQPTTSADQGNVILQENGEWICMRCKKNDDVRNKLLQQRCAMLKEIDSRRDIVNCKQRAAKKHERVTLRSNYSRAVALQRRLAKRQYDERLLNYVLNEAKLCTFTPLLRNTGNCHRIVMTPIQVDLAKIDGELKENYPGLLSDRYNYFTTSGFYFMKW